MLVIAYDRVIPDMKKVLLYDLRRLRPGTPPQIDPWTGKEHSRTKRDIMT